MSVAVAHQESATGQIALKEAAREASLRQTSLAVIHVVEALDLDMEAAFRSGLSDEVTTVLTDAGLTDLGWDLYLATAADDVPDAILKVAGEVGAELLVIGARRRSPVGKFLLGSVTQTLVLDADMPILVVKRPA